MKKIRFVFLCILLVFVFVSCGDQKTQNIYFSDSLLASNLVPQLPKPKEASTVLSDNGSRVYIDSNQSASEYALDLVLYVNSLNFDYIGTANSIIDTKYCFKSTLALSSVLASHYYYDADNSYIIIYSNAITEKSDEADYIKDAHLIRVCCDYGEYNSFKYDYYIEFVHEPNVMIKEPVEPLGTFKLELIDENNNIINKTDISSRYTPGTQFIFYAKPIIDADLVMYVNDELYKIQNPTKFDGNIMWEYRFDIPSHDVVIEFRVEVIEYLSIKGVLNIPTIAYSDIQMVKSEQGYIGVAPGMLTNIKYSTDIEDINSALALLEVPVYEYKGDDWQICGGGYIKYSFITNGKEYMIEITNGFITVNNKHYKFANEYISFEHPNLECHSFITYIDSFDAYTSNGTSCGTFNYLSKYEFKDYSKDGMDDYIKLGYLETEFGRIMVFDNNIFSIELDGTTKYYETIGDFSFTGVFAEKDVK